MSALRKPVVIEQEDIAMETGTEDRVRLHGITWEGYEHLLAAFHEHPGIRVTYCEGEVEIMVVSYKHEIIARDLSMIVSIFASEWDKDFRDAGSTTFKLRPKERGFEPDGCFYFTHLKQMARVVRIDLSQDPAPDLIIEVDISSSSISRFPIFASLGIKEIWRFHKDKVEFLQLRGATWVSRQTSRFVPGITPDLATDLLKDRDGMTAPAWQKKVRHTAEEIRAAK